MTAAKPFSYLLLLALFSVAFFSNAQSIQPTSSKYYVRHFGEDEGLLQNTITSILPDSNDFLWVGTEAGITRFNGNQFLPLHIKSSLIQNNFSRTTTFYFKGNDTVLAFSAYSQKVATIVKGKLISIEEQQIEKHGLFFLDQNYIMPAPAYIKGSNYTSTYLTAQGVNLQRESLIGTTYNKDTFLIVLNDGIGVFDNKGLISKIKIDHVDPYNVLFVGHQIIYIDKKNYLNYYSPNVGLQKRKLLNISSRHEMSFFYNRFGDNFYCVADSVLYRASITASGDLNIQQLISNLTDPSEITTVYEKDNNTIITGTYRNGLYIYRKRFLHVTPPLSNGEADQFYSQIFLSDNETIFTGRGQLFKNNQYIGKINHGFKTNLYNCLRDRNGNFWYATHQCILRSREIGSSADTAVRFEGVLPSILFEDRDGRIWVATSKEFGYVENNRFIEVEIKNIFSWTIACMRQDSTGKYFIGTHQGLFILDSLHEHLAKKIEALNSYDVRFIWPDANGTTWICTYGNGLFLIDTDSVSAFPKNKDMLSYVHCVVEDGNGYFWLPTNNGLFVTTRQSLMQYAKNKNKAPFFYLFSEKDGLRTNEFNGGAEPAFLRFPNGDISLPSMKGLVRFTPSEINFNFSLSPILIDNILLDSLELKESDSFDIGNQVKNISFSISSSFWGERENDMMEYQVVEKDLLPRNDQWLLIDELGKINLFSPSYGYYQLMIRKRKGLNEGQYTYRTINFHVLPKWYETKTFLIAIIVAVIFIMLGILSVRRNYYRRANQVLKQKIDLATIELQQMNNTLEKKVEERTIQIQEAEIKFRTLVERSLVGVYIVQDNKFIYLNPKFEEILGYNRGELVGANPLSIFNDANRSEIAERIRKRISGELDSDHYEIAGMKKDGSECQLEFFGSRSIYEGKPTIIGTMLDITEKKIAETQLIKEKDLSQSIINNLPGLFYVFDKSGKYLLWNKNLEIVTGYTGAEISKIQAGTFTNQQGLELVAKTFEKVYIEGYAESEATLLTKDGREFFYYFNGIPVTYREKQCILGIALDISERKKAQEERELAINALQKSEANLKTIFLNTDTTYVLLDSHFKVIAFNQRAAEYIKKELKKTCKINTSFIDYYPESRQDEFRETIKTVMLGNQVIYEIKYPQPDGKFNWYYTRLLPISNSENIVFGMMVVINDITEKKLLEQEIMEQKTQEQKKVIRAILMGEEKERNKIGQELHDNINQILAGTKLYLSIIEHDKSASEAIIKQSMQFLDNAMEEIRELSKYKVTPAKSMNLQEMLQTLVDRFYETTKIEIDFTYDGSTQLINDDLKLNIYRIIQEQLNNILKHAQAKKISILINAGEKNISITVNDDGNGFEVESKKKGIGIANMTNRVESFNGTMKIESSPGNGCKIEISLPI